MRFPLLRGFVVLAPCLMLAACSPEIQLHDSVLASEGADHSVVIASHLYSLYDPGRVPSREPRLVWPGALEAFGAELERIDPRQVFLLGDNTRNARDEEWELVERVLAPLKGRVQFAAGNHDASHLETFAEHGGVRFGSKVVGRNKYIQLDCVKVLDEQALAFLERELADADDYAHVFLLMHYFLAGWDELDLDEAPVAEDSGDPNASARFTNWQRDVVPLIAGKVDAVFVGDYRSDHVRSTLEYYEGKPIRYVLNSFGYGYDEGVGAGSDGPLVFLELQFRGDDFAILPRAVPLDLRHGAYGFAARMEMRPLLLDWVQVDHGDEAAGIGFQLAYKWKLTGSVSEGWSASIADPLSDERLHFAVRSIPLASEDEAARAVVIAKWLAQAVEGEGDLKIISRAGFPTDGVRGLWAKLEGQLPSHALGRYSQVVVHRGQAWSFTLSVPGKMQGEYLQLWDNLISRVTLTH